MSDSLTCKVIIEIAGYPENFVKETMDGVVNNIKSSKDLKFLSHKDFPVKKIDKMFSTFTEFDLEFNSFNDLVEFCFTFMPSSVDILNSKPSFEQSEVAGLLNDLMARLHNYDMVVKSLRAKNVLLQREINKLKS